MPGIAGIIAEGMAFAPSTVDGMIGCMWHPPVAARGTLLQPQCSVGVAWVRHGRASTDLVPTWNAERNVCVVLVGDVLASRNRSVDTPSAAEEFVSLYTEAGLDALQSLNGVFCGLLMDLRSDTTILFNDRYGLGRIYYHQVGPSFYFSSQAKSLLTALPKLRQIDSVGLAEQFSNGCVLQERSLFTNVSLLPGGSCWEFHRGRLTERARYFDRTIWEDVRATSADEFARRLEETLLEVVPQYATERDEIALSLTGGIDSRIILAAIRPKTGALPCYTFGGAYRDSEDVKTARQVAAVCGQPHKVLRLNREFFREFPRLAAESVYLTDGAMDVSGAVGLYVNRRAAGEAPIRLTGNYGSEILRGHVAFRPDVLNGSMFAGDFLPLIGQARDTYSSERSGSRAAFITFKQVAWHHYARYALENSQLSVRSPYLDNRLCALAFAAPTDAAVNQNIAFRFIAKLYPALGQLPTDRGAIDRPLWAPKKAWAWWKEFLPRAEYAFDYGMPNWLAKLDRVLSPLQLDKLFLGQQKYYHFRKWYRTELSEYIADTLTSARALSRPYLNAKRAKQIVTEHVTGRGNYTLAIHKLLSAELTQQYLTDQ